MIDSTTRVIPFNNNNDTTRNQMADGQCRQNICLKEPEIPYIRTGYEEQFLNYTSYFYKAKADGEVIYRDKELLIVKYNDESIDGEVINLGWEVKNYDGFEKKLNSSLVKGETFRKDSILARHNSISEDGFLRLGTNLTTTYLSHPYGFKDAIPISESCAKKMAINYIHEEAIEFTDLIPIIWKNGEISYPQGTYVEKAQEIFYVKSRNPLNVTSLVSNGEPIRAAVSGKLYYKIVVDEIVKMKHEEEYYDNLYSKEVERQQEICHAIDIALAMNEVKADAYKRFYGPQVNTKRSGKSIMLFYWIVTEIPVLKGSKICNRHGNKGVVSIVLSDDEMPKTLDGLVADVVASPLSVPSRMNVGQLFENHMTAAMKKIYYNACKLETFDEKKNLILQFLNYVQEPQLNKLFDEQFNEDMWNNIEKTKGFQIIQRPFNSCKFEDLYKGCLFAGMNEDLKEDVIMNGKIYRATIGFNYWYRLEHEPYKKTWGRSVGEYSSLGQPGKGTKAHRIGEMETWALCSYEANNNLTELFLTKSDSLNECSRAIKYLHDGCAHLYSPHDKSTGIMRILQEYLNAVNYNINLDGTDEEEITEIE